MFGKSVWILRESEALSRDRLRTAAFDGTRRDPRVFVLVPPYDSATCYTVVRVDWLRVVTHEEGLFALAVVGGHGQYNVTLQIWCSTTDCTDFSR